MALQLLNPGSQFGPGSVVQVVSATNVIAVSTSATIPYDNTIPQNTEGAEIITCSITPKNASSVLVVKGYLVQFLQDASAPTKTNSIYALFRDSTSDAIKTVNVASIGSAWTVTNYTFILAVPMAAQIVAGSVSATTFKIRAGATSSNGAPTTQYYNNYISFNNTEGSRLEIWEIAA
jgi:hypothetical protein